MRTAACAALFAIVTSLVSCDSRREKPLVHHSLSLAIPKGTTDVAGNASLIGGYLRVGPAPAGFVGLVSAEIDTDVPGLVPGLSALSSPVSDHEVFSRWTLEHGNYETSMGRARNEWRIEIEPRLPIELTTALMTGVCELHLGGTAIRKLDARVDQGTLVIDFANAPMTTSCAVEGEVGTGQLRVRYPPDAGVRVRARKAVGGVHVDGLRQEGEAWVNDAFATAAIQLDLSLGSGFGEVVVEPAGNE